MTVYRLSSGGDGDRVPDPYADPHGRHAIPEVSGPHIHVSSPRKLVLNFIFELDLLASA